MEGLEDDLKPLLLEVLLHLIRNKHAEAEAGKTGVERRGNLVELKITGDGNVELFAILTKTPRICTTTSKTNAVGC